MSDKEVENVPKKDTLIKHKHPIKEVTKIAKRPHKDEEDELPEEIEEAGENGIDDASDRDTTINKFKQLQNRVGQVFKVMANGRNKKRNRIVLVPFNLCPSCSQQQ